MPNKPLANNNPIKTHLPALIAILALFSSLNMRGYEFSFLWLLLSWLMLLGIIIAKLFVSYKASLPIPTGKPFLLYSAFLFWATLSLSWSETPGESLLLLMTFSTGLLAMLLGFWAEDKQWRSFIFLLVGLVLIVIAYTTWQRYALDIKKPTGFLLNWNTNSAFIGLILLPYCALFINRNARQQNNLLPGIFIALCSFGISLGQSRGALMALVIGLAIVVLSAWRLGYSKKAILQLLAWLTAGFLTGDLLNDSAMIERLGKAAQITAEAHPQALKSLSSGRHALWAAGWQMFLERPILGWGLGTYHFLYPQFRTPLIIEKGQYAHNDYLQFLLELGPVGLLLSLAFVASIFCCGLKLHQSKAEASDKLYHLTLLAVCIGMLIHSAFTFNLYHAPMLILLGLYTGRAGKLLSSHTEQQINLKAESGMTRGGYYSILTGVSTCLSIWALTVFIGFQALQQSINSHNPLHAFQHLRKASQYLPFLDEYQSRQAFLILAILSSKSAPDKLNAKEAEEFMDYALTQVDAAIENNPLRDINYSYKAKLLHLKDRLPHVSTHNSEIVPSLQQALKLNPYRLTVRLMLVDYLQSINEDQHAQQILQEGLDKAYYGQYTIGVNYLLKLQKAIQTQANKDQLNNLEQQIQALKKNGKIYYTGPFKLTAI